VKQEVDVDSFPGEFLPLLSSFAQDNEKKTDKRHRFRLVDCADATDQWQSGAKTSFPSIPFSTCHFRLQGHMYITHPI
jgi:hypothetical protein